MAILRYILKGIGPLLLGVILWGGYVVSGQPLYLTINGQSLRLRSHQPTVALALQAAGIELAPEDRIEPPPVAPLTAGQQITIRLAQPITIEADGRTLHRRTHRQTAAAVLVEAGFRLNPRDQILVNGQAIPDHNTPLPVRPARPDSARFRLIASTPRGAVIDQRPQPVRITLRRAVPITLNDEGLRSDFYTTQPTIGEALAEQEITLFEADRVTPGLDTPLSPGMRIYIKRSIPVDIRVDGRTLNIRTHRETVGQLLAETGVALMGQDYSRPPLDRPITAGDMVEVVRVREKIEIEQQFIPFETTWLPDETMEIDRQEVRQTGANGIIKSRSRVRYENGQEVWRHFEDEWLDQEPTNRTIAYGTNIVIRTLETEEGTFRYWRRIAMLVTPYSAATSGKAPDHPLYGITRSGIPVRYGIVAVDPRVIPLGTELYVPDYGKALAADTGGLILGKHIDLAYEEDQPMPSLYEWRDIYVLTPVPPADQIRYVLPQWPQR